ncbi:MAG: hypothetical protein AB1801_21765 [Chloroflexota bacterium]
MRLMRLMRLMREALTPEAILRELVAGQRSQLVRNIAALQARLAQIPAEIEAEQATIQARFADPQPRLLPVAVTFLVPERLGQ